MCLVVTYMLGWFFFVLLDHIHFLSHVNVPFSFTPLIYSKLRDLILAFIGANINTLVPVLGINFETKTFRARLDLELQLPANRVC